MSVPFFRINLFSTRPPMKEQTDAYGGWRLPSTTMITWRSMQKWIVKFKYGSYVGVGVQIYPLRPSQEYRYYYRYRHQYLFDWPTIGLAFLPHGPDGQFGGECSCSG